MPKRILSWFPDKVSPSFLLWLLGELQVYFSIFPYKNITSLRFRWFILKEGGALLIGVVWGGSL